jgi:hypothetical protein
MAEVKKDMEATQAQPKQRAFFNPESKLLPSSRSVQIFRLWLPAVLIVLGIVLLFVDDFNGFGVDAFAAFVGAGASIMLTNILWRMGVSGDEERDEEAEARKYLAEHGRWPDES